MDLTHARLVEVVSYDPATGLFAYLSGRGKGGAVTKDGYLQLKIDGRLYFAHRLAWLYVHGVWPSEQTDHRNGIRRDNRIENLREATAAENGQNQVSHAGSASRCIGVTWHARDRRWQAQIRLHGQIKYLGYFDSEDAAAAAYARAKAELHPFQPTVRSREYGLSDGATQKTRVTT